MRLTDSSHRSEPPATGLRRVLHLTLAVVAAACLATAPGARATPLNYVFTSNASVVLAGDTEAITGFFTFDTTTDIQTAVSIVLSGPAPYSGTYTSASASNSASDFVAAGTPTLPFFPVIFVDFADDLNVTFDPLTSVVWETATTFTDSTAVTGAAVVPEPASLALLGVAVGLFLFIPRANRRDRCLHAEQPKGL
jgi:hypothetical protein